MCDYRNVFEMVLKQHSRKKQKEIEILRSEEQDNYPTMSDNMEERDMNEINEQNTSYDLVWFDSGAGQAEGPTCEMLLKWQNIIFIYE